MRKGRAAWRAAEGNPAFGLGTVGDVMPVAGLKRWVRSLRRRVSTLTLEGLCLTTASSLYLHADAVETKKGRGSYLRHFYVSLMSFPQGA